MKRKVKTILRKAESMRQDAKTAIGGYRLYTFIPWEQIPEEIKPYFPENSEEAWDKEISTDGLEVDIEIQVKGLLNDLARGNILRAVMLLPTIIADIFILGHETKNYERRYRDMLSDYSLTYWLDTLIADIDIVTKSTTLINDMLSRAEINPGVDIKEFRDSVVSEIFQKREDVPQTPTRKPLEPIEEDPELMGSIDKALEDYRVRTGIDLVEELRQDELELELELGLDEGSDEDIGTTDKDTKPKHIQ